MENLGEKFRLIRIHHGLTQKELGDLMGKLAITIRRIEKEQVKLQIEDIENLAKVLKLNFFDVLTWPEKWAPIKKVYETENPVLHVNELPANYNCKNCESLRMVIDIQNQYINTLKNDLEFFKVKTRATGS